MKSAASHYWLPCKRRVVKNAITLVEPRLICSRCPFPMDEPNVRIDQCSLRLPMNDLFLMLSKKHQSASATLVTFQSAISLVEHFHPDHQQLLNQAVGIQLWHLRSFQYSQVSR